MTYKYALEKHDISRIDKLNKLTDTNTFQGTCWRYGGINNETS